jgi:hypothetical protein
VRSIASLFFVFVVRDRARIDGQGTFLAHDDNRAPCIEAFLIGLRDH